NHPSRPVIASTAKWIRTRRIAYEVPANRAFAPDATLRRCCKLLTVDARISRWFAVWSRDLMQITNAACGQGRGKPRRGSHGCRASSPVHSRTTPRGLGGYRDTRAPVGQAADPAPDERDGATGPRPHAGVRGG